MILFSFGIQFAIVCPQGSYRAKQECERKFTGMLAVWPLHVDRLFQDEIFPASINATIAGKGDERN